jgi:ABC-type dipeptide/oligopeptide/nickel transport system permease subunit
MLMADPTLTPSSTSPPEDAAQAAADVGDWSPSPRARAWRRLLHNPVGVTGACLVLVTAGMAVFAPWLAPYSPYKQFPNGINALGVPVAPEWRIPGFFLGTDTLGRDLLSRIIWGARVSLEVGIFATAIAVGIGVLLGLLAATSSPRASNLLMRLVDVMMAFPFYLFVMLIVSVVGHASTLVVVIVLGVLGWPPIVRMVRGQAVVIREEEYVLAAEASGASQFRIMWRHILPNVLPTILVFGSLQVSGNIMAESGLSFLGLGVPPPTPSWGEMISEGLQAYQSAPWILIFPGIALALTMLGFNLLADGLNEALRYR